MQWDPQEFGNISRIRVPVDKIWTPGLKIKFLLIINFLNYSKFYEIQIDILLYNSADSKFDSTSKVNALIGFDGKISYIPPGMFKSTCEFKFKDFPFDEQVFIK